MAALEQFAQLPARHRLLRFERDPARSSQIGRGNDSRALDQLHEFFVAAFQRKPVIAGLKPGDGVHLPTHLEHQRILPLHLLGSVRQRHAEFLQPFNIHGSSFVGSWALMKFVQKVWLSTFAVESPLAVRTLTMKNMCRPQLCANSVAT